MSNPNSSEAKCGALINPGTLPKSIADQIPPHGTVGKIIYEGPKNTYVIIVNKDHEETRPKPKKESKGTQSSILPSHGKTCSRRPLVQNEPSLRRNLKDISDEDVEVQSEKRATKNVSCGSELRLDLSTIQDDEYDSHQSSSSVFLKPESVKVKSESLEDSAIEQDMSPTVEKIISPVSRFVNCHQYENMTSTLTSPSQLVLQRNTSSLKRPQAYHVISPLAESMSKLGYNTPTQVSTSSSMSSQIQDKHPAARKIYLVTPSTSQNDSTTVLQKSVSYMTTPHTLPKSKSKLMPIQSAGSPAFSTTAKGLLTSTPVQGLSAPPVPQRVQGLRQGIPNSSPSPVYIISSPLVSRQNSSNIKSSTVVSTPGLSRVPFTSSSAGTPASQVHVHTPSSFQYGSPSFESSGYFSGSSDLQSANSTPRSVVNTPRTTSKEVNIELIKTDIKVKQESSSVDFSTVHHRPASVATSSISEMSDYVSSSQESIKSESSERENLDNSLTNIQWLKGMQFSEETSKKDSSVPPPVRPTATVSTSSSSCHNSYHQWRCLSSADIRRISAECGREKRPPFSYMALIQMALCSREDKKMMLKEICKWIEDTFPYYKYAAKPGWKNSIRHNLSLYNIFVREPSIRHGSYWTMKMDISPKQKSYKDNHAKEEAQSMPSLPSQQTMIPIFPMFNSLGNPNLMATQTPQGIISSQTITATCPKKKGPLPILPRPSPLEQQTPQAYALIPIQHMQTTPFTMGAAQNQAQQPVVVHMPTPSQSPVIGCPSPVINEVSAAVASIQLPCPSPLPSDIEEITFDTVNNNKDTGQVCTESSRRKGKISLVRQAWLNSQQSDMEVDPPIDSLENEKNKVKVKRTKSKRPRVKPGLPKPKIYKEDKQVKKGVKGNSKKRKMHVERNLLQDSSDDEADDDDDDGTKFLKKLEKDFSTPMRNMLEGKDDTNISQITSTPFRPEMACSSPPLPSPIRGLTPLKTGNIFDGSFLDSLKDPDCDMKSTGFSPDSQGAKKYSPQISPTFARVKDTALADLNMLPFLCSPDRGDGSPGNNSLNGQNISKLLNEMGMDTNGESIEDFPNLNWSAMQSFVNNIDNS